MVKCAVKDYCNFNIVNVEKSFFVFLITATELKTKRKQTKNIF